MNSKYRNNKKKKFSNSSRPSRPNKRPSKKRVLPTIDTSLLVKKASDEPEEVFTPSRRFDEMPIRQELQKNLLAKGFEYPTQIQHETLEILQSGRDLVGIASTGTGKTGAFVIPIVDRLLNANRPFQSLIIAPTRELALQIDKEIEAMAHGLGFKSICLIGGTNVDKDVKRLRRHNHIIIATPGRLIDLAQRNALRLDRISVLVLDEFDRMLDMGFIGDIRKIIGQMTNRQQTMMFSATVDKTQNELIGQFMTNPEHVRISNGSSASDQVEQDVIKVYEGENKFDILLDLMADDDYKRVLLFAETKHIVKKLSEKLNKGGVKADQIHGNKSQHYRSNALQKFKSGQVQVLVATDVAARGIDVSNVTHVINYQIPQSLESYVHRIGRTGRAGKRGKALTFVEQ